MACRAPKDAPAGIVPRSALVAKDHGQTALSFGREPEACGAPLFADLYRVSTGRILGCAMGALIVEHVDRPSQWNICANGHEWRAEE